MSQSSPILLAYSGGLDTSFCVPWLAAEYQRPVVTVNVDTGGLDADGARDLAERARALGAVDHVQIDARQRFYDTTLRHLIAGNVRRGQLYPLCVGAERSVQAQALAELAAERGADTVAHGCTAAGNDQVRFEVALRSIDPKLNVLAPVRDQNFARETQIAFLTERNLPLPSSGGAYSINRGLWGVTIGGRETLTSVGSIPEQAWVLSAGALRRNDTETLRIRFAHGEPVALDEKALEPVALIETLETIGGRFGVGRGIHVGDTILGTKGRVAFEAPAADILLTAHRELEKLTLSAAQARVKESLALTYGDLVHEGQTLDPACRDIEALLASSQRTVSGTVTVELGPGRVFVTGVESPHSLLAASRGVYGEAAGEWTAADALGFSRIRALPGVLLHRAVGDVPT
ncbi:MAG: argininosuccinate synthase [Pseudomonadota bacterium]